MEQASFFKNRRVIPALQCVYAGVVSFAKRQGEEPAVQIERLRFGKGSLRRLSFMQKDVYRVSVKLLHSLTSYYTDTL